MTNNRNQIVVNSTASDFVADECCSFEEYDVFGWIPVFGPHIAVWQFIPPVIIVLGTFGNVMTIVMMRRMSEGQSSHTMSLYFTALAVSDLVILYTGLLRDWVRFYFGVNLEVVHILFCKLLPFLVYSNSIISAWLLVAMTMQRVMSIVWPHYKSLSCTKRRVGVVIATIFAVPNALNLYKIILNELIIFRSTLKKCFVTKVQEIIFDNLIYPWIDLTLSSIVPFCILIVSNIVLVWKVIQSVHVARVMTAGGCDQVNSRQKKASSLTLTLITVSLVFLILSMPVCIYLILEPYLFAQNRISKATAMYVFTVCNLAWYTNSAVNFYLYCLTGSRFRSELKSLFCGRPSAQKMSKHFSRTDDKTYFSNVHSENDKVVKSF